MCVCMCVRACVCVCMCVCMRACVCVQGGREIRGRSIDIEGARKGRINLIKNHERRYVTTQRRLLHRKRNGATRATASTAICLACSNWDYGFCRRGPEKVRGLSLSFSFPPFLLIEDKSPTRAHGVSRLTFDCVMLALLIDTLHFR